MADDSDIEVGLLIEAIHKKYGYGFRDYSMAHVKRRILNRLRTSDFSSISAMQQEVIRNGDFAGKLLQGLSGISFYYR